MAQGQRTAQRRLRPGRQRGAGGQGAGEAGKDRQPRADEERPQCPAVSPAAAVRHRFLFPCGGMDAALDRLMHRRC